MSTPGSSFSSRISSAWRRVRTRTGRSGAVASQPPADTEKWVLMNIDIALKDAMSIAGAVGVALVDYDSGMSLGTSGGGEWLNLEVAAAGNTDVVRSKLRVMAALGLNDSIED